MSIHISTQHTIREASVLSGLPESTLRYYESIGIIRPIERDRSSGHRVYSDEDIGYLTTIGCLSAIGMSLEDMRAYLRNRGGGAQAAPEQIVLLETQQAALAQAARELEVRRRYVDAKIAYWNAVADGDETQIARTSEAAKAIVGEIRALHSGISEGTTTPASEG